MTSATTKRRRLALMAAGTAAAMVLLPATASAQQQEDPLRDVMSSVNAVADSVSGGGGQNLPDVPGPALNPLDPQLKDHLGDPDEDRDSEGHETDDPQFPDHGAGSVADVELGDQEENQEAEEDGATEIADVTEYDATIEDDASSNGDATVLALFGDEIFGSHADSEDGPAEESENFTEGLCEGTDGGLCLSLLYSDAYAAETDDASTAGGRAGVLALCLGGNNGDITTSDECDGPIVLGAAEGIGVGERNDDGNTATASKNEALNLCLGGTEDQTGDTLCDGLGLSALNGESASAADDEEAVTEGTSHVIGFDAGGDEAFRAEDSAGGCLPPVDDQDAVALLCLFVNQGEEFVFGSGEADGVEYTRGAASAVEALHLDVLRNTPLEILVELGKAESIARDFDCPGKPGGPCPGEEKPPGKPDKPECSDGIDNDGDGDIDFGQDKDCESPEDDSEAGDGAGKPGADDDGLATTGANIAPMLAAALAMLGLGALTVAATRRRVGKHTV